MEIHEAFIPRGAEWAWRDACISHLKNGIYGEMWVAAMLAAAYVESDMRNIIHAGLAQIPARSRLAADLKRILDLHAAGKSREEALELIHTQWDETSQHDWCHTNSNAQVVADLNQLRISELAAQMVDVALRNPKQNP